MKPRAIVPLAPGFEEIEAIAVIDILRRADVNVIVAGVDELSVTGSHGITVVCDVVVNDCDTHGADAIVLPGGLPGATNLGRSTAVTRAIAEMDSAGKLVAAICAAPTVLNGAGLLEGKRATSHPNHRAEMDRCNYAEERVVTDGNAVTSRGAGTAIEFAAELVRRLVGDDVADDILAKIQFL